MGIILFIYELFLIFGSYHLRSKCFLIHLALNYHLFIHFILSSGEKSVRNCVDGNSNGRRPLLILQTWEKVSSRTHAPNWS